MSAVTQEDDYAIVEGVCHPPGPEDPNYDGFLIRQNEMERIAKTMVGKPFMSEHGDEGTAGELIEAKMVPDIGLVYKARIDRGTIAGAKLYAKIKSGVATGASMGLSHFENKDTGKIEWRVVREVSGVKNPDLDGTPFLGVHKDTETRALKRQFVDQQLENHRLETEVDKLRKIVDERQAILQPILSEMSATPAPAAAAPAPGTAGEPAPAPAATPSLPKIAEEHDKIVRENLAKLQAENAKLEAEKQAVLKQAEYNAAIAAKWKEMKMQEFKRKRDDLQAEKEGVMEYLATISGGKDKIPKELMWNLQMAEKDETGMLGFKDHQMEDAENSWRFLEIQTVAYKRDKASVSNQEAERKERQEREAKMQEELKKAQEEKAQLEQFLKSSEKSYKISSFQLPPAQPAAPAPAPSNTFQAPPSSTPSGMSSSVTTHSYISTSETIRKAPCEAMADGKPLFLTAAYRGGGMATSDNPAHKEIWGMLRSDPLPAGKWETFSHHAYNGRTFSMPDGVDENGCLTKGNYILRSSMSPGLRV